MRRLPLLALGIAVAASASGCATSTVVVGSTVTVAVDQPFTSLNPATSLGRSSSTNADVAALTGAAFFSDDDAYGLLADPSFGTAQIVASDPLTVRYTIAADATWSDGTPIDAADLVLAWAADSGALNTPDFDDEPYVDPETGRYTDDFPDDVVYFDGRIGAGLERATQTPLFDQDDRTLVVHFDAWLPGWRTALAPTVPAHVLQEQASGRDYEDAALAKEDLVATILTRDPVALAALSRTWNDAWNLEGRPVDDALLVSAGPYQVAGFDNGGVTLTANPSYRGSRRPTIQTLRIRYSPDPLETVGLLTDGAVDVATFTPDAALVDALRGIDGVTLTASSQARFEHLDLQMADSRTGAFADARVRQAFLHVVPRQQILDEQVARLHPDAALLDSFTLLPGAPGYHDAIVENGSQVFGSVDVAAAVDLLAQAGAPTPTVCILFDPASERRRAEFDAIRDSAARAGFRVTDCSSPDWQGLLGVAGAYDAALFAWDTTRLGPGAVGAIYRTDSALANFSRYSNPEVDTLLDAFERAESVDERAEIATRIDARLWADAYGAPLYAYPTLTAVSERVAGVSRSPTARGVFWNAWDWQPAPID